jgi:hypothetical protein
MLPTLFASSTLATTAAAVALDRWATLDAMSHIAYGDKAFAHTELCAKHTLVGAALNAGAMGTWAWVHARIARRRPRSVTRAFVTGAAVAALAYVVDYHVVPRRLTPGFEARLSPRGFVAMYAVMAASLAAGELLAHGRTR